MEKEKQENNFPNIFFLLTPNLSHYLTRHCPAMNNEQIANVDDDSIDESRFFKCKTHLISSVSGHPKYLS